VRVVLTLHGIAFEFLAVDVVGPGRPVPVGDRGMASAGR
jgi:hypothetical protein